MHNVSEVSYPSFLTASSSDESASPVVAISSEKLVVWLLRACKHLKKWKKYNKTMNLLDYDVWLSCPVQLCL